MRGRGLKQYRPPAVIRKCASPPVRGRGLKQPGGADQRFISDVAPRAGAWIETNQPGRRLRSGQVAPRAGAWIETPVTCRGSSK